MTKNSHRQTLTLEHDQNIDEFDKKFGHVNISSIHLKMKKKILKFKLFLNFYMRKWFNSSFPLKRRPGKFNYWF